MIDITHTVFGFASLLFGAVILCGRYAGPKPHGFWNI